MSCAVERAVNKVVTDVGFDCLGNEEKRLGATPQLKVAPAHHRATVPLTTARPTGQACGGALTRKCEKAVRTISQPQENRKGVGKPTNVVKDLATHHVSKAVNDIKDAVTCHGAPPPVRNVGLAPAETKEAFLAHMRTLFPGWHDEKAGFVLGDQSMVELLAANLSRSLEVAKSETPFALALTVAERLADVTGGDVRHARQVLDHLQNNAQWLQSLFDARTLQPLNLLEHLSAPYVPRRSPTDAPRLGAESRQNLALQVALSLSRHTHDFQALRKILNPQLDLSPDDTRVYTKPSSHFFDHTNPGCADGLLQQAMQALDTLHTAQSAEDRSYARRCLTLLCQAREAALAGAQDDGTHSLDTFKTNLNAEQRRDLFAWNQGMRTVDEMISADACMQKNCVWLDRSETIEKSKALRWTPAPLRSLFWGKAPYQASKMGDGGASAKHPDEMLEIYRDMRDSLLRRLYAHCTRVTGPVNIATLRAELNGATAQARRQRIGQVMETLVWQSATQYDASLVQHSLSRAMSMSLHERLRQTGIRMPEVITYLRDIGLKPNADRPLSQLIDHYLSTRVLTAKLDDYGLLNQGALQQNGQATDADTRSAEDILKAMRRVRKMDVKPEEMTISGINQYLKYLAYYGQDNSWRAEEKLSGGINGVVFAGLAKFHSVGMRLTGIAGRSAFISFEHKNWAAEIIMGYRTHRSTGADVRYSGGSENEFGERLKGAVTAALGYDSDYSDTEAIKIHIRRDYDDQGNIKNAVRNGQFVFDESGKPVQAHRAEAARVFQFFADGAQHLRFGHVPELADQTLTGEARLAVFTSFANKFFDSNLVSVSQTHATSSSQKTSAYAAITARAALERDGKSFQVGASVTPINASYTASKSTSHDQNGSRSLDMVSYTHAVDVRAAAGVSGVLIPRLSPKTALPTTANPIGSGVTANLRVNETRGQVSILREHDMVDAVFSYSGENYKKPKEMQAALERELAAWSGYFGGEAQFRAALAEVVATCKGENAVLMIRRRLRASVGPKLDMLEARIKFQRDVMCNPKRSEKQRVSAYANMRALQNDRQQLLSRPESYEPFGIGSFARVEKSRSRGLSYYLHFVNTQSVSATQELSYKSRKPADRDWARHLTEHDERDLAMFAPLMHDIDRLVEVNHNRMKVAGTELGKHHGMTAAEIEAFEQTDARTARRYRALERRAEFLQRMQAGAQELLYIRHQAMTWELQADKRAKTTPATPQSTAAAHAAKAHADRLWHLAAALECAMRHLVNVEQIRADEGRREWVTEISTPSYGLLRRLLEYSARLDEETQALAQNNFDRARARARRNELRRHEAAILRRTRTLLATVNAHPGMRQTDAYGDASAHGWVQLHRLAESWERLHAATLSARANNRARPLAARQGDEASAASHTGRAERRLRLEQRRDSLIHFAARGLSDDERLVTAQEIAQYEHMLGVKAAQVMQWHEQLTG